MARFTIDLPDLDGYTAAIPDTGIYAIISDKVDELTDMTMTLIADLIATLIDAGSEREAVLENDTLRDAIAAELKGWSTP